MKNIKIIFGTMTYGPQVNFDNANKMIKYFLKAGYNEIDTAFSYNEGETELILGQILNSFKDGSINVATKVNPRITGCLDEAALTMQLNESLKRLNRDAVDVLYLHMPDLNTPIESTLLACNKLFEEGKFKKLGLSNFPSWMVVDIWHICNNNGWLTPSVYQGLYNAISRSTEKELLPALHRFRIPFYAFNPLAGGMLTGKYTNYYAQPAEGRFMLRQSYRERYWKKELIAIVAELAAKSEKCGMPLAEASLRWLAYHSNLNPKNDDAIVIGASNLHQLEQNLAAMIKGALPESMVSAFDSAWGEARSISPDYFRFYNA